MWDNSQNILHKLLIILLVFIKKIKKLSRTSTFLVSCPKGQVKKNANVEACYAIGYLSPLTLWVRIPLRLGVLDLRKVDGFLLVSSTNKTYLHDITEILNIESDVKHHRPNQTIFYNKQSCLRKKKSGK